jgi:hypothetical protein
VELEIDHVHLSIGQVSKNKYSLQALLHSPVAQVEISVHGSPYKAVRENLASWQVQVVVVPEIVQEVHV